MPFSKTLGYQPNKCHFSKLLLPGASFNLYRQNFSCLKFYCRFFIHKPCSPLALLLALLQLSPSLSLAKRALLCIVTPESFTSDVKESHSNSVLGRTKYKGPLNIPLLCENYCLHLCTTVLGIQCKRDVFKSI